MITNETAPLGDVLDIRLEIKEDYRGFQLIPSLVVSLIVHGKEDSFEIASSSVSLAALKTLLREPEDA